MCVCVCVCGVCERDGKGKWIIDRMHGIIFQESKVTSFRLNPVSFHGTRSRIYLKTLTA